MNRFCTFAWTALAVALLISPAQAQDEGMLLRSEQVRKELKITDDQQQKVQALIQEREEQMRDLLSGIRDLPQEERRAKMIEAREKTREITRKLAAKLDTVLDAAQRERLTQILIQVQGGRALTREAVAKQLELSEEQQKKIREVMAESLKKTVELGRAEGDRQSRVVKMVELRNQANKDVMAVLNDTQQAKLEKMKGEKFELDRSQLRAQQQRRPDA